MDDSQLGNSELGDFQLGDVQGSIPPSFEVTVENTLDVSQTLLINLIKNVSITNTSDISQLVFLPSIFVVSISNTLNISQTIAMNKALTTHITNTLNISHLPFVNSPRVLSVSNQGVLNQIINVTNATFTVIVSNSLTIDHFIIARQGIFIVSINNTANISQNIIIRDRIFIVSITQNLDILSRINLTYKTSVTTTADILQSINNYKELVRNMVQMVSVTNTFTNNRDITRNLENHLNISNVLDKSGTTWNFQLSDYITLTDVFRVAILVDDSGYTPTFPAGPGIPPVIIPRHPVVTGVPLLARNKTTIESNIGSIILPTPELGDIFTPKVVVNIKKTVSGKIYTYIKTNPADKFTLTWVLGLYKALELQAYLKANIQSPNYKTSFFTLYLWNGEIWKAKMVSNDIPITFESRWQNSENNLSELEKVTVSIQFEGTKQL